MPQSNKVTGMHGWTMNNNYSGFDEMRQHNNISSNPEPNCSPQLQTFSRFSDACAFTCPRRTYGKLKFTALARTPPTVERLIKIRVPSDKNPPAGRSTQITNNNRTLYIDEHTAVPNNPPKRITGESYPKGPCRYMVFT